MSGPAATPGQRPPPCSPVPPTWGEGAREARGLESWPARARGVGEHAWPRHCPQTLSPPPSRPSRRPFVPCPARRVVKEALAAKDRETQRRLAEYQAAKEAEEAGAGVADPTEARLARWAGATGVAARGRQAAGPATGVSREALELIRARAPKA